MSDIPDDQRPEYGQQVPADWYLQHTVSRCTSCGEYSDDLRFGVCFDCASQGEKRAAKRTVLQHLASAVRNLWNREPMYYARYDVTWAWQRLTRTGDYARGGTFEGYDWR